jgi:hypothetical protein
MSRFLSAGALAVLLVVCATPRAGAGSAEQAGGTSADAPAFCTSYSTGADTHTACAPPASAPQGSAIACHNYTVGSDTHAECGPVPAARLSVPRQKNAAQVPPPASALRCYTYHIGSSSYTDCR